MDCSSKVLPLSLIDGVYQVCGRIWSVGPRYLLSNYVGGGTYGEVCRAHDVHLGLPVAVKKVSNIHRNPSYTKCVLREVCILRRLSHPYIVTLTDVFTQPSGEREGELDLYIATEFADRGDMYNNMDALSASDVKHLTWQLLVAVEYMHSMHVWHRDIKSANVLMTTTSGASGVQVKLGDFGLSRSALEGCSPQVDLLHNYGRTTGQSARTAALRGTPKLVRQYSRQVVSPAYRAPEVFMSQGQYSGAIDMWSIGCVFWELLIRSLKGGQILGSRRPILFEVGTDPLTPKPRQNYAADGPTALAHQLDVLFDVVGRPCWKDIESVPCEAWRAYLKRMPGRIGCLASQLAGLGCDPEAIDLLSRLLEFNPSRRCTAEEALSHEYFRNYKHEKKSKGSPKVWSAIALGVLERQMETAMHEDQDGGRSTLLKLLEGELKSHQNQNHNHNRNGKEAQVVVRYCRESHNRRVDGTSTVLQGINRQRSLAFKGSIDLRRLQAQVASRRVVCFQTCRMRLPRALE